MKISNLVTEYKNKLLTNGGLKGCHEIYKWELLTKHTDNFNLESDNFIENLSKTDFGNLIDKRYSRQPINRFCSESPIEYKKIIQQLYDETVDLNTRISNFKFDCKNLYEIVGEENKHHNQSESVAATLLSFRYPQKYTFYLPTTYDTYCDLMGKAKVKRHKYEHYLLLINEIIPHIKADNELYNLIKGETSGYIQSDILIAQDLIYQTCITPIRELKPIVYKYGVYSCNIDISVDEWKQVLQDDEFRNNSQLRTYLNRFYSEPEHKSTCKNLCDKYGEHYSSYNATITNFGKFVQEKLNRFKVIGIDHENSYWIIPMIGKYVHNNKYFEWQLRPELLQAAEELNILNNKMQNIDKYTNLLLTNKNIILTGAPGTGKSYLAKCIAEEITKYGGEVGFVQFHPSYDYTDFVEGLRAEEVENGGVTFSLKNGIFKEFCKMAVEPQNADNNFNELYDDFITNQIDDLQLYTPTHKKPINFKINSKKSFEIYTDKTNWVIKKDVIREYVLNNTINGWKSYTISIGEKFKELYASKLIKTATENGNKKYVFIIDEINRGEISKIFGELFFSIDPGYRGKVGKVKTQYQNLHSYETETIFDSELGKGWFYVPENVYIIGTMNDIDRSVESMDFAMRRRFTWIEIDADSRAEMLEDYNWAEDAKMKMTAINEAIDKIDGLGKAYHIGPAYFLKLKCYESDNTTMWQRLWEYHIEPLIKEYLRGMPSVESTLEDLQKAYYDTTLD